MLSKQEEKSYLRYSYLVIFWATLVILMTMLGFFFLERLLVRAEIFIGAYFFATLMFLTLALRERRFGTKGRLVIFYGATVLCFLSMILYFIRRWDSLMDGLQKVFGG